MIGYVVLISGVAEDCGETDESTGVMESTSESGESDVLNLELMQEHAVLSHSFSEV
jgi:hypothetical protein